MHRLTKLERHCPESLNLAWRRRMGGQLGIAGRGPRHPRTAKLVRAAAPRGPNRVPGVTWPRWIGLFSYSPRGHKVLAGKQIVWFEVPNPKGGTMLKRFGPLLLLVVFLPLLAGGLKLWADSCTTTLRCPSGAVYTFQCIEDECVRNCYCSPSSTTCVTIRYTDICEGKIYLNRYCCSAPQPY